MLKQTYRSLTFFWYDTNKDLESACFQIFVGVIPEKGLVGLMPAKVSFGITRPKVLSQFVGPRDTGPKMKDLRIHQIRLPKGS